jgi:hypothetical protein
MRHAAAIIGSFHSSRAAIRAPRVREGISTMVTTRFRAAVFAGALALGLSGGAMPVQAAPGEPSASHRIASAAFGVGDYETALAAWQKCADAGEAACQAAIGYMMLMGIGVEQDTEGAAEWLENAAEAGDAYGAFLLGLIYHHGDDASAVDYARAFELFEQADRGGILPARSELAMMHLRGHGVPVDRGKAIELFLSAGKDGEPISLMRAGALLQLAEEDPDPESAFLLFKAAAELDFPQAMYVVGDMIRLGQVSPADPVEALMWFLLAAQHPRGDAELLSFASRMADIHGAKLSAAERDEAHGRATAWVAAASR